MLYKLNLIVGEPMLCEAEEVPRVMLAWKQGIPCRIKTGALATEHLVNIVEEKKIKGPLKDIFAMVDLPTKGTATTELASAERPATTEPARPPKEKPYDPWKKVPVHK